MELFKKLIQERWFQITLAAVLGITVGALFYPTQRVEERVKKEITEKYELEIQELKSTHQTKVNELNESLSREESSGREFREETSRKITSLTTENRELKQSMKRKKFKLVKPDGTIIEKEYEESESSEVTSVVTEVREEFDRKVASIESKWKKIHLNRVKKLKETYTEEIEKVRKEKKEKIVYVEKEKIVEVNKKKLRPEIGVTTGKDIYIHTSYSLWGPVFIGAGASGDIETKTFEEARVGVGIEL